MVLERFRQQFGRKSETSREDALSAPVRGTSVSMSAEMTAIDLARYKDLIEYEQEQHAIETELNEAREPINRLAVNSPYQLRTTPEILALSPAFNAHIASDRLYHSMEKEKEEIKKEAYKNNENFPYVVMLRTLMELEFLKESNKLRKVGIGRTYQEDLDTYLDIANFFHSGSMITEINGIRLCDILQPYSDNLPDLYRGLCMSLMHAFQIYPKIEFDPSNESDIEVDYPITTGVHRENAVRSVPWLLHFTENKPKPGQIEIPYNKIFSETSGNLHDARVRLFENLMDPTSPDFADTASVFLSLSRLQGFERYAATYVPLLRDPENAKKAYQQAVKYVKDGVNPEFYKVLADILRDQTRDSEYAEIELQTTDDLDEVIDAPFQIMEAGHAYASTLANINRMRSVRRLNSVALSGEEIAWRGIVPPQEVEVTFDRHNPNRFCVNFGWENEYGEELNVKINLDAKNRTIDWNLLESIDAPEVENARDLLITQAAIIIEELKNKTIENSHHAPRVRNEDPIYRIRKEVKDAAQLFSGPIIESEDTPRQELSKPYIEVQDIEYLREKCNKLSNVDAEKTIKAIMQFNEKGLGKFDRKKTKDKLYTLSVSCSGVNDVRVLVEMIPSGKGNRPHGIVDIDYRKAIYRKTGIRAKSG